MLKKLRRNYKRLVAFMLTIAMTFTNVGANLNVAFAAGETEDALFMLNGNELLDAVQDALDAGGVFDLASLELTAKSTSLKTSYEKLLGTRSGIVYNLDVEIDDSYAPDGTSMQAFYNAGTEDVVFLFINESDMVVSFRANVDGYETQPITINPNNANVENAEDADFVEDYSNVTMVDDVKETLGATVIPARTESGVEVETETTESVETEDESEIVETDEAETLETEAVEAETESSEDASVEESSETLDVSVVASEEAAEDTVEETESIVIETEAETEVETEAEAVEEETDEAAEVELIGLSIHEVYRVATSVEILDEEVPLAEETAAEAETIEEDTESEDTLIVEETIAEDVTVEETTVEESTVEETGAEPEETTAEETTEAEDETDVIVIESEAASDDETESSAPEETDVIVVDEQTPSNAGRDEDFADEDGQMLIDDSVEVLGNLDGKSFDTVTIWGTANARAVRIALSDIAANVTEDEDAYLLYIIHMLTADDGRYRKVETFDISADDFINGELDTASFEYEREGMRLVEAPVIGMDWFEDEDGVMTAYAELSYEVLDGWHVVDAGTSSANEDIALFSVYIGNLDDIDIEEDADSLIVKIQFLNEQGVQIMNPYALEAEENGDEANKTYTVEYELPEKAGYTVTLEDESAGFTIEDGMLTGTFTETGTITVNVIYVAGEVSYTVKHWYQNLDGTAYVEDTSKKETLTGHIDTLTEARDLSTDGFTALEIEQQVITADGATVKVYYDRNEYTLLYDTTGGSYVPSVTAKYGAAITLASGSAVPTRTGYTFAGWYLDEDLKTEAGTTITLGAENVTVYAKWTGETVSYKVVYMTENADDANYSYAGTVELTANAGTEVTATASTTKPSGFDTTHFTFKSATTETVAADGSTVVVAYYSRNVYTITFNVVTCGKEKHTHSIYTGCYSRTCDKWHMHSLEAGCYELTCTEEEHEHSSACYSLKITAKYEAYIGDQWNALVGPGTDYEGKNWNWEGNYYTGFQAKMPGENKTISTGNNGKTTRTLYYYVEDPTGSISDPKNTSSGIKFSLYTKVVLNLSDTAYPTYNEEFFPIDGYDRYASTISAWSDGTASSNSGSWDSTDGGTFYYTRSIYELVLHNGSTSTTKNVAYKSDISGYLKTPTYNPLSDGTFDGWYLDPTFKEKYSGDSTMPKGLILYAKWNPVSYTVTFQDASAYGTEIYATQTIVRSKTVSAFIPEKTGYIFKGWYTDDACTTAFDYATQITGNTTVYAKWAQSTTTTYSVTHQLSDGTVIQQDASHSGKVGATVIAYAITTSGAYAGYVPDKTSESITLKLDSSLNKITFTYSKTELKYTVQYKYGGECIFEEGPVTSAVNTPKVVADIKTIKEKGYQLADGQVYQIVTLTSGDNIVVFNIEPATYTIEYELNGGKLENGDTNPNSYVPINLASNPITLKNPVKLGYEFTGWTLVTGTCKNGDHNPLQTVISKGSYGNLKFEAGWKALEDKLVYDANEGTGSMSPTEGYTFTDVTVSANGFTRAGYHFTNWNTASDGTGTSYSAGDAYTLTPNDDILYAQWEKNYEIKVVAESASVSYNGKEQSVNGFKTLEFTIDGASYTVSGLEASATGTNAGTYESKVTGTPVVKDAKGDDVTYKFTVTTVDGQLVINKRNVTLTSADATKEYDGTPLTNGTVNVGGEEFADGEGATWNVTGSQTLAGSSANTFTYELNNGTNADNYNITKTEGILTVTNRNAKYEITVVANSGSGTYDGTEKSVSGFQTLTFTVNNQTFTVEGLTASAAKTDAGTYSSKVTGIPVVRDASGNDVTEQFIVKTKDGTLTINPRKVTLTSGTSSKEYDGKALTNTNVTVAGDGFVTGEGATYNVTGTITLVGSIQNVFTYTLNDGTKAGNYVIEVNYGTLTILSRTAQYQITVEAKSDTVKYDGSQHTVNGFKSLTFTTDDGNTYTVSGLTAYGEGTNAGSYTVAISGNAIVSDADGNDVTSQFSVTKQPGTLTITKREVIMTSATDTKQYDGTPLTNSEVTVTGDGFAANEGAGYSVTGSQTLVGSSENTFTYMLNEGTNADNYTITTKNGQLTVTNREAKYAIEVVVNSGEFLYDGAEKTVSGFVKTEFTVAGQKYVVSGLTASASATDAGTTAVNAVGTAVVKDAGGNDVTSQFAVTVTPGTLVINKRVVTLTSATAEKEYDGTPLTNSEVTVTGDGFAANEGAAYTVTGSQTLKGSSDNYFTYTLNSGTKADNYTISTVNGTLTVTDRSQKYEITVEANSGEYKYDGTEKTVSGLKETSFTLNGQTYTVEGLSASAAATDAGSYTVEITGTAVVKDAAKNDVTAQFIVKETDGKLEITKRVLTMTSATDSKQYDGTALTNQNVEVTGDGFAAGEGAAYDVTGSQTIVGSSDNTFTYTLNDGTKAENYEISQKEGTLTVVDRDAKYEITVEANGGTAMYDGTQKTVSGLKQTVFTVDGQQYTVEGLSAQASGINAGEYTASVEGTAIVKDAAGNDVTAQFAVYKKSNTLYITKRSVVLTSGSAEREYNGMALTNDSVTVSGYGFAAGEGAVYNVTGSQTLVGGSKNTFSYTLNSGTIADNYVITTVEGQLTVTNRGAKYNITVEANSGEFKYDGTEKNVSGFKTLTFVVDGQTYTVSELTAEKKATDAGEYAVNVVGTPVVKDAAGNDVSAQFAVSTKAGQLTITKREVVLTSATDAKTYDGTPLTNDTVSVSGDGFAEGEGAVCQVTGKQTLVGSSDNTFSYTLSSGTQADNYTIKTNYGTLTVIDRSVKYEITVEANSGTEKYDGTEKSVSGFKTLSFTVNGLPYTVEGLTAEGKGTDAGTYQVKVSGNAVVKDAAGNDVTNQFTVRTTAGTLTIEKRNVTLTSATDSKQYDGTPLKNETVTVSGEGFAEGEGAVCTVTGSQLLVGTSANSFTYTLNANTKADNYNITKQEGQLSVTNRDAKYTITVEANSGEFKYDGTEKTVSGFKETEFTVEGQKYTVSGLTASAAATDAGTTAVNAVGTAVVKDAGGNDVTSQFEVIVTPGTLVINKRDVTLTSADDSKEYNGTPLTNDKITVSGDGFVDGEGAVYDVTGSQILAGSSTNAFSYTLDANTKADNYNITKAEGTLTVTARAEKYVITVKANSGTGEYDGTEKTVSGFETLNFTVDGQKYTVEGLTAEISQKNAGTYTVKAEGTAVVKDIYNNDVTSQFTVHKVDGQLTIAKRDVTLTSASAAKSYDGTALTDSTVMVGGKGFADGEGAVYDVTGSQTLVGTSKNTFGYTLNANTLAGNYEITKTEGDLTVTDDGENAVVKEHADGQYGLGDTITFTITVKNIYAETKTITIKEQDGVTILPKDGAVITDGKAVFSNVAPDAVVTVDAAYVVTEEDLLKGEFTNKAQVEFSDVDRSYEDEDTVESEELDDPKESLEVKKEITNDGYVEGTTEFSIGDTITYKITVTNTGNVTMTDIPVEDVTTGKNVVEIKKDGILGTNMFADYTVDGTVATIKELKPSEKMEIICTYVVVKEDNGSTILNTAIAGKDDTKTEDDVLAKVEKTYDITVKHEFADVNNDGVKLPDDYVVENKLPGYAETFTAGEVKGYAASPAVYNVLVEDKDITITFVYYKDVIGTDPTNPDKPDQIPDYYQITFTFVSEDTAKGTVTDVTREVHNLYEMKLDEDGRIIEVDLSQMKPISPNANVTVTPANRYRFTNWTSDQARVQEVALAAEIAVGDTFGTIDEIRESAFITDTVFTAHFAKKSSGGGGGGGSSSGGSGTTTIDGPGVPTAGIPEVPVLEMEENEIPLAPLPKTGHRNANVLLMMLSSSLFAAIAVTGKRRKEQE